ncbi:MAG: hypothetical protein KF718_28830 [Polyangiaceae bacterium]|nr:hypothetical protein [Polyangiaceae bacterium]
MRGRAAVATFSVLAGCGGGPPSAQPAHDAGPQPVCVDVALTPTVPGDEGDWSWLSNPIVGGLWASDAGVHFAWKAYEVVSTTGNVDSMSDTETRLVLTTIAADGTASHVVHSPFPPGTEWGHIGEITVAGRADGVFAVGHDWWDGSARPLRVAIGRVDPPSLGPGVVLPFDGEPLALHTAATWDGEAFALHAYGGPVKFTQYLARVDDQANVLLPFTPYAVTSVATVERAGYALSTSAASGQTFLLEPGQLPRLSGHLRNGEPLPGTEAGPKVLAATDPLQSYAASVSARADASGAWLAWKQHKPNTFGMMMQRVDNSGMPVGTGVPLPFLPMGSDGIGYAALVSHESSVVALAPSDKSFYRFVFDGQTLSEFERILTPGGGLRQLNIEAIEHQCEIWLSYYQADPPQHLRVLKAVPGCIYPTWPTL